MSALWAVDGTSTVMIFLIGLTLPDIRNEFNISPVQEGYLGSAFFVALTTLSLPSAIWMSRFSPSTHNTARADRHGPSRQSCRASPRATGCLLAARLMFMYALVSRTQAEVMLIQQWFSGPAHRHAELNHRCELRYRPTGGDRSCADTHAPCRRLAWYPSPACRRLRRRRRRVVHRRT